MDIRKRLVGTYDIGDGMCDIFLREGTGADFYFYYGNDKKPVILLGADYSNWNEIVSLLVHESLEFTAARTKQRYQKSDCAELDHGSYIFIMSHGAFTDCCARVGCLLADALPDICTAWKKWKK
jgi:hypothetical protein